MKKKAKRYDDGGDVATDTSQGQNQNIGDDVRSRAMAAMSQRDMDEGGGGSSSTPAPAPKAAPKAASKASTPAPKAVPTRQQKSGPIMMRGSSNSGTDLKAALFGGSSSSDSPRTRAAKRDQAMTGSYSMKSGGKVGSASKRADGIAQRGRTRGKMC